MCRKILITYLQLHKEKCYEIGNSMTTITNNVSKLMKMWSSLNKIKDCPR